MPCVCVRQCVGSVCGTPPPPPPCLLRWFTPHSKQCQPPGLHCGPTPRVKRWHGKACASTHTHMLTHMEWPVTHSPISPLMCCRAPLSCTAYSCAFTGTHTAVVDIPLLPCCGTAPLALLRSLAHGPVPSITGPCYFPSHEALLGVSTTPCPVRQNECPPHPPHTRTHYRAGAVCHVQTRVCA